MKHHPAVRFLSGLVAVTFCANLLLHPTQAIDSEIDFSNAMSALEEISTTEVLEAALENEEAETNTTAVPNSILPIADTQSDGNFGYANYQLIMPEGDGESTYTVTLSIFAISYTSTDYYLDIAGANYDVTVNGTTTSTAFPTASYSGIYGINASSVTFTGVNAGSTVSVENILSKYLIETGSGDYDWRSYDKTFVGVVITPEDGSLNTIEVSDAFAALPTDGSSVTVTATENVVNDPVGSYTLTLPNTTGAIYNVSLALGRLDYNTQQDLTLATAEEYSVTVTTFTGVEGEVSKTTTMTFSPANGMLTLNLTSLGAGSIITVDNVLVEYNIGNEFADWGSYKDTFITATVTNPTDSDAVFYYQNASGAAANPAQLAVDGHISITATEATFDSGNYALVLPDVADDTSNLYDITLTLSHTNANDGSPLNLTVSEVYELEITAADGTVQESSGWYVFEVDDTDNTLINCSLTGIAAGSTITVKSILTEKNLGIYEDGSYTYGSYIGSSVSADVKLEDAVISPIEYTGDNPATIVADKTVILVAILGDVNSDDRVVGYDFTSEAVNDGGGEYNILYMLNNYNVVSLDNIESTHIVGPILALDIAQRTQSDVLYNNDTSTTVVTGADTANGVLVASDYANGISSYVGTLIAAPEAESASSAFELNYGFESGDGFTPPYFYTREIGLSTSTTQSILSVSTNSYHLDYIQLTGGTATNATYVSPNYDGYQYSYQSDTFIDATALTNAMISGSEAILLHGDAEYTLDENGAISDLLTVPYEERYYYTEIDGVPIVYYCATSEDGITFDFSNSEIITYDDADDTDGVSLRIQTDPEYNTDGITLTINAGESWMILAADQLEVVDILYPAEYDYFENPYPFPTTFNFVCNTINPIDIDIGTDDDPNWVSHSQLPTMLVNGEKVAAQQGENGEYGEGGKKIIWNMPNLVTNSETGENRLVTYGTGDNILGHIIAPNAEFWNYSTTLTWEGGNINGTVIVKSFYSGNAQIHMWPYDGANEYHTAYNVSLMKAVNDAGPLAEFTFALNPTAETAAMDGLANQIFPLTVTTEIDASAPSKATFSNLIFTEPGTYTFEITEVIPDTLVSSGLIYDYSVYQIAITVIETQDQDGNNTLSISNVTQTKITDSTGDAISDAGNYTSTSNVDGSPTYQDDTYPDGVVTYPAYFNNLADAPETYTTLDITLTKSDQMLNLIEGVEFLVERVVIVNSIPTSVNYGFEETYTTGADGTFTIEGLSANRYYMITELTKPSDENSPLAEYETFTGYWLIETVGDVYHPSLPISYTITEYDANHNIVSSVTDTLYNTKIEFTLPDTGGIGAATSLALGISFMLLAALGFVWHNPFSHHKTRPTRQQKRG